MDDPSTQLQSELDASVRDAFAAERPILTHLNADTSWLLQLPYPEYVRTPPGRSRFNVLIDPWLDGPQSDVSSWFSTQWHTIDSCVKTIDGVNRLLHEVQNLLDEIQRPTRTAARQHASMTAEDSEAEAKLPNLIDLVVISHEFSDHCHKQTLLQLPSTVPVMASPPAASVIKSWSYFTTVLTTPPFTAGTDWRLTTSPPLPRWLSITHATTPNNQLYYHSALLLIYDIPSPPNLKPEDTIAAEAIVYTPHGIASESLTSLRDADPTIRTVALLHGAHDVGIWGVKQLNLGGENAVKVQKVIGARYWIGTHDEVKKAGGFLAPFLRRRIVVAGNAADEKMVGSARIVDLRSGESLVLEGE